MYMQQHEETLTQNGEVVLMNRKRTIIRSKRQRYDCLVFVLPSLRTATTIGSTGSQRAVTQAVPSTLSTTG